MTRLAVAVVGATGHVGSIAASAFPGATAVGRTLADPGAYDVVVYCAGSRREDGAGTDVERVVYHFEANVEPLSELADAMRPGALLVYVSSTAVLEGTQGEAAEGAVRVECLDAYARSQLARERVVAGKAAINSVGLRLGMVVGHEDGPRPHTAAAVAAASGTPLVVRTPRHRRPVTDAPHLRAALQAVVRRRADLPAAHAVYNLASRNVTVLQLWRELAAAHGAEVAVEDDGTEGGFHADSGAFHRDFLSGRTPCRVCGSAAMASVLDLGEQPLANAYPESAAQAERVWPLHLTRCEECTHAQVDATVPPSTLFTPDYAYASGTSQTMRKYFEWFAGHALARASPASHPPVVLELACNDGSQLDAFAALGCETHGVDPAADLAAVARGQGHDVRVGFWGTDEFELPRPDVIVAQNVVAHVPDPVRFLRCCERVMGHGFEVPLFVQTSQCRMFERGEFDTVYHEHPSFFSVASMRRAARLAGLWVARVDRVPVHGTSLLFELRRSPEQDATSGGATSGTLCKSRIENTEEEADRVEHAQHVAPFAGKALARRAWTLATVARVRAAGFRVAGFGAAAKGVVFLNYCALQLDYVVDESPLKQGRYVPGTKAPIVTRHVLEAGREKLCVLVLAWNFWDEALAKIRAARASAETPAPETLVMRAFPAPLLIRLGATPGEDEVVASADV